MLQLHKVRFSQIADQKYTLFSPIPRDKMRYVYRYNRYNRKALILLMQAIFNRNWFI